MPPRVSSGPIVGANSPTKPARGARKSGMAAAGTRTARKSARHEESAESEESNDEATTVVKSSSGSNPRTESDPKDRKDTESADIESSLLQPTHNRQASSAPGSVIRSRATRDAPPSTGAKVVTAGGKRAGKGKGIRGRRMTSHDVEDDESSPKVSSRSRSGRGGGVYNWDVESLGITEKDIGTRLTFHNSIATDIEREGKMEKVKFRRGDKLWILPDPSWLPPQSRDVDIEDLDDDLWWVGEVLDCCALDQTSQDENQNLGLLRVCWFYTPDQALDLPNIHEDYKKKLRKYRWDDNERIRSDHVDFCGIECFGGFADGIETFVSIHGVEVDDRERLQAERKGKTVKCRSKAGVRVDGFSVKEIQANVTRNANLSKKRKTRDDDE